VKGRLIRSVSVFSRRITGQSLSRRGLGDNAAIAASRASGRSLAFTPTIPFGERQLEQFRGCVIEERIASPSHPGLAYIWS